MSYKMKENMADQPIRERFEHLLKVLSSQRFLQMQGLANEIPFFICPYRPVEAVKMQGMRKQLLRQLARSGIRVLEICLYDLTVNILMENGDWEWYLEEEPRISREELKEELQSILDVESVLVPAITARMEKGDYNLVFLSGVGEVFPYIRAHNVLNNLQSRVKDLPVLMFFPGEYTHSLESGASLDLFGRFRDDKYYRAFNIYHYEP